MCYLGWAGDDCNSTSPLSYLVVGPTAPVSGKACNALTTHCLCLYLSLYPITSHFCPFILLLYLFHPTSLLSLILLSSPPSSNPFTNVNMLNITCFFVWVYFLLLIVHCITLYFSFCVEFMSAH